MDEAPTGMPADFVAASHASARTDENGRREWRWRIIGAYAEGRSTLIYPVLPATPHDFNPRPTDDEMFGVVKLVRSPGGYAAARPRMFTTEDEFNLEQLVTGASGRMVVAGG